MEWNEFCEKVSRMLGNWKNRLQFNYDNNKISYIIATQEYIYTIDNYNDLRQQAERYDFERYSICDGNSYESVVDIPDIDSRRRFSIGLEDKLTELIVSDEEADITYSFHEISRQLIWYVIKDFDVSSTNLDIGQLHLVVRTQRWLGRMRLRDLPWMRVTQRQIRLL